MYTLTLIAEWMKPRAKAIGAGLSTLAAGLLAALPDGLTFGEVLVVVIATLGAAGVTYAVPNQPATSEEPTE